MAALCYSQIGGLRLATIIELIMVTILYAIFVADLGILKWGPRRASITQRGNARRRLIHHLDDFSNGKPSWESETTLSCTGH